MVIRRNTQKRQVDLKKIANVADVPILIMWGNEAAKCVRVGSYKSGVKVAMKNLIRYPKFKIIYTRDELYEWCEYFIKTESEKNIITKSLASYSDKTSLINTRL